MNTPNARQRAQLAFVDSGQELEVGQAEACPLPPNLLARTTGDEPYVSRHLPGGLTAHVYRIEAGGRSWTLKRARERCLVQNLDGQTSFLNEVQRRADLARLKAHPELAERLSGVVDTCYASYRRGILLSPWIDGEPVTDWTEARLIDLFDTVVTLASQGLFEWDLCPGNVLDDGRIRLFDFGYMYRFDPLREYNSNGTTNPEFHPVERFETRQFFAWLLGRERLGSEHALAAFVLEKRLAIEAYRRWQAELAQRGAESRVLDRLGMLVEQWRRGIADAPDALYLRDAWHAHRLDLADDLDGQTCTPLTLQRIAWLRHTVADRHAELRRAGALDAEQNADRDALLAEFEQAELKATRWQVR